MMIFQGLDRRLVIDSGAGNTVVALVVVLVLLLDITGSGDGRDDQLDG